MSSIREDYEWRLAKWSDIQGHLPALYEAAAGRTAPIVLELGVRRGTSTVAFLAGCEASGGHVWSVDNGRVWVPAEWLDSGLWTFLVGDDLDPDIRGMSPTEIDVLFVDTSHAYLHTLAELRAYVPRVKPGGVVMCHDTELEAPELVGTQPPFPVARALDEYCAQAGLSWQNRTGSYGLGVIDIPREGR